MNWLTSNRLQGWKAPLARVASFLPAFSALCLVFTSALVFARPDKDAIASSFSIDVDGRYDDVMEAVNLVANNGVIDGTFEYKGDESLPGAELAPDCSMFDTWRGPGKVICKIRKRALSPSHFINSNDVGTVAVRYIVQTVSPTTTRLFIDAIFLENSHHHPHPSDGYVETTEFAEVAKHLKQLTEAHDTLQAGYSSSEASPRSVAASEGAVADAADLQKVLAEQQAKLHVDSQHLADLERRLADLQVGRKLRVVSERGELKSNPYSHSSVITAVPQGASLLVIAESEHWYEVRANNGKEGWIHHSQVEAQP